jgi:hypothetical protein
MADVTLEKFGLVGFIHDSRSIINTRLMRNPTRKVFRGGAGGRG